MTRWKLNDFNGLPELPKGFFWYVKDNWGSSREKQILRLGRLKLTLAIKYPVVVSLVAGSVGYNSFAGNYGKLNLQRPLRSARHGAILRASKQLYRKAFDDDGTLIYEKTEIVLDRLEDRYNPIAKFRAEHPNEY